jgi:hypothetical protein
MVDAMTERRKRQVRGITLPHPPRRTRYGGSTASVCIDCGQSIDDWPAIRKALDDHTSYRHPCGRLLIKGDA